MKKYLFLLFFTIIEAYSFAQVYVSDRYTLNDYYQFALEDNELELSSLLSKKPGSFRPDFYDGVSDEKINLIVKKLYEVPSRGDWILDSIINQNPFTLMIIEKKYFDINFIYDGEYTLLSRNLRTVYTYDVPEIYIYLLENGADPSIKDKNGINVIEDMVSNILVDWKKIEVLLKYVDDMKDYNPDILIKSIEADNSIWKECVEKNIDINITDSRGNTALHKASERGNLEAVQFFIEHGVAVDCQNKDLMTPLMLACKNDHLEIVSYLISKKAKVNKYDEDGWTPLKYSLGNLDIMKILLDAGAKPNAKNKEDKTPIGNICVEYLWTDYLETFELLAEYKTNFKAVDEKKENTLAALARSLWKFSNEEVLELVDFLVSKGCNINSRDYLDRTIMNYCEDPELAQELIKRGAHEVDEVYSSKDEYITF